MATQTNLLESSEPEEIKSVPAESASKPTEAQEGELLVAYLRVKGYRFTHIANETGGSLEARRRAVRMKRQGVSRGFPDYLIIVNDQLIAIELKRQKGSSTSPEQRAWLEALNQAGLPAKVCRGFEDARAFVEQWSSNS